MDRITPELLQKYAEGRASEKECMEVEQWLENEDNIFEQELEAHEFAQYHESGKIPVLWRAFLQNTKEGVQYIKLWWWGTRVAMPTLLLAGVGVFILNKQPLQQSAQQEMLTLEVPQGHRSHIKLDDSTEVFLAGQSKLIYPKHFEGKERRISLVYGHAFLHVSKDAQHPFVLQSDSTEIRVLGTMFDVSNRIDHNNIAIVLKEGSVEFNNNHGALHRMVPGDKISYNKQDREMKLYRHMDVSHTGEWTSGRLRFAQTQLQDVVGLLEEQFNTQFKWTDTNLSETPVTGNFDGMPFKRILFLLQESTGLNFEQNNNTVTITK